MYLCVINIKTLPNIKSFVIRLKAMVRFEIETLEKF